MSRTRNRRRDDGSEDWELLGKYSLHGDGRGRAKMMIAMDAVRENGLTPGEYDDASAVVKMNSAGELKVEIK